jgi:hypothetical protein
MGDLGVLTGHPHSLQLFPSRTTWVYSINNVLMSLSGVPVR